MRSPAALALVLAVLGCRAPSPSGPCLADGDCSLAEACVGGRCQARDTLDGGLDAPSDDAAFADAALSLDAALLDAGSPDAGVLTLASFAERFAATRCAYVLACANKLNFFASLLNTVACNPNTTLFILGVEDPHSPGLLPDVVFDPVAGEACLEEFADVDFRQCTRTIDLFPEACGRVFTGVAPLGARCVAHLQCESGTCSGTPACPGACLARPAPLALGVRCTANSECEPGLRCIGARCAPIAASGGVCDEDDDCSVFQLCHGGSCEDPGDLDAPCDADFFAADTCSGQLVCVGGLCARTAMEGATCDATHRCAPGLQCVAIGGESTCQPFRNLGEPCVASADCVGAMGCFAGRCEYLPGIGDPCFGSELRCMVGQCDPTGTCAFAPPGAACEGDLECREVCNTTAGVCESRVPEGSSCAASGVECVQGTECSGGTTPTCIAC